VFVVKRIFRILLRIVIIILALSVVSTLFFRWVPVPLTPLMLIRCVEQKANGDKMVLKHDWVPLEDISPNLQLAVVCSEDQNFLIHHGFDWGAIEKAFEHNSDNKRLRGGSTISQQTAKNVFLWPGRSYVRKGFEVWFTLLIELFWSKERIMEVYLNSIEMGKGVYGAEAAARVWFKKPASGLTADDAAAITAILPNPRKYVANPPGPYISRRKQWVKQQMRFWGNQLDYNKYNESGDTKPVPAKKRKRAK
jgi:monofunctional biosynthetic peptidoglycan transglycosylase